MTLYIYVCAVWTCPSKSCGPCAVEPVRLTRLFGVQERSIKNLHVGGIYRKKKVEKKREIGTPFTMHQLFLWLFSLIVDSRRPEY